MKKDCAITLSLLGRWLDTEYDVKLLANVSKSTLDKLVAGLTEFFEDLDLTVDDVKLIWKNWFDWATFNGTLIHSAFVVAPNTQQCSHEELQVMDLLVKIACDAIDRL